MAKPLSSDLAQRARFSLLGINAKKEYKFPIPVLQITNINHDNTEKELKKLLRLIDDTRGLNASRYFDKLFDSHWNEVKNDFYKSISDIDSVTKSDRYTQDK